MTGWEKLEGVLHADEKPVVLRGEGLGGGEDVGGGGELGSANEEETGSHVRHQ